MISIKELYVWILSKNKYTILKYDKQFSLDFTETFGGLMGLLGLLMYYKPMTYISILGCITTPV